jgi:hypothetical protein
MRKVIFLFAINLMTAFLLDCQKEELVSSNGESRLEGRVYSACMAVVPIGWVPPPLERVFTIIVFDKRKNHFKEFSTDDKGKFSFLLPSGTYFVRVKESPRPTDSGPFQIRNGEIDSVAVYYNCGIR